MGWTNFAGAFEVGGLLAAASSKDKVLNPMSAATKAATADGKWVVNALVELLAFAERFVARLVDRLEQIIEHTFFPRYDVD